MNRQPLKVGAGLAVLAALSFGVTTPLIEHAGRGVGALSTAALLYTGACFSAFLLGALAPSSGAPLRKAHLPRLLAIALLGAAVAPTLLAWGLQRAGATTGSLLLNTEAVFTVLLARMLYQEPIGRRVTTALLLMTAGGVALTLDAALKTEWNALGALAIAGATAAWALDNTLTRSLAEQDPVRVVAGKGALGALMTSMVAVALGEPRPEAQAVLILLACGATGYGLSLRLYLLAQRHLGAARTGSIFAVAPFIGATLAWLIGDTSPGRWTWVSTAFYLTGVFLHVTEHHRHPHVHPAMSHDHPHHHDDGHHDHPHHPPFVGQHSHPHWHPAVQHDHDHAPDLHHGHPHP